MVLWMNASRQTNHNGNCLYDWYIENSISYNIKLDSSFQPTRYGHSTNSFVDLFFISADFNVINDDDHGSYLKCLDFDSDHMAIQLMINLGSDILRKLPKTIMNFSNFNWDNFIDILSNKLMAMNIPTETYTRKKLTILLKLSQKKLKKQ